MRGLGTIINVERFLEFMMHHILKNWFIKN